MNCQDELYAAIPHRPPMLLIDEIIERQETRIICRKTFHAEEFFFSGHYPNAPIVPGVILCEAAMQAGAVLLSAHVTEGQGVPVATRMNEVKFKRAVRPGESVELDVTLVERMSSAFFLKAKVSTDGRLAARLQFGCTVAHLESS